MAELPVMPMFWDAYFGDTKHLTTLEHGAYLVLLGTMWRAGGSLPGDDLFLTRAAGLTSGQWRRMRTTILAFMHQLPDGRITQDKLLETFNAVRQKRQSRANNARAMWLKKKGRPDAFAFDLHKRNDAIHKPLKEPSFLPLSLSPREKKKEAAEGEQTKPPEPLAVSPALAASRLVRKAS